MTDRSTCFPFKSEKLVCRIIITNTTGSFVSSWKRRKRGATRRTFDILKREINHRYYYWVENNDRVPVLSSQIALCQSLKVTAVKKDKLTLNHFAKDTDIETRRLGVGFETDCLVLFRSPRGLNKLQNSNKA